jgi:hypothetical protein
LLLDLGGLRKNFVKKGEITITSSLLCSGK